MFGDIQVDCRAVPYASGKNSYVDDIVIIFYLGSCEFANFDQNFVVEPHPYSDLCPEPAMLKALDLLREPNRARSAPYAS